MRRLFATSALAAIVLGACASPTAGPARPIALEQVDAGIGPDVVAARQTVLDFLRAYVEAPADDGLALSRLVTGPKLDAWVRWLAVQNRSFRGTIDATVDVRSVGFVAILPIRTQVGARMDLSASVTFSFDPVGGDPFQRTRIMDGPVTLVREGVADWRVLDATRDGVSMDAGIQLFDHLQRRGRGVTVRLDSLFQFTPNWQFNVIVQNRSGASITLEPSSGVRLLTNRQGHLRGRGGAITDGLLRVPDGSTVEGLVAFPLQPSPRGRIVALTYRSPSGPPIRFAFPMTGKVTPVPVPPTTSPGAPGAAS
jgi:hypothetical protein